MIFEDVKIFEGKCTPPLRTIFYIVTFVTFLSSPGDLIVWVQTTKECPVVVDIMGIILGVIGAIVAIGLMLILMWKVFTTIHDRREYARFEKEQRLAKWDAVRGNSS